MLIPAVEDALAAYLRQTLPLTADQGAISFEAPTPTWAEQLTTPVVDAFLYSITRSPQPPRASAPRTTEGGRVERRAPLPLVRLGYLVSAWADSPRAEHSLLGDALTRLMSVQVLPAWAVEAELSSSVQVALAADDAQSVALLWQSLGTGHKASFVLEVTVASDAYDWEAAATSVTEVATSASVMPRQDAAEPGGAWRTGQG